MRPISTNSRGVEMTAEWSKITPRNAPKPVEQARQVALDLRARVPAAREAIRDAKARLAEVEETDKQQMAERLRRGEPATSDVTGVERARTAVAVAERQSEALLIAVEHAEREIHN